MIELPDDDTERPSTVPWPPLLLAATLGGAWALQSTTPLPWPGLDDAPAHAIGLGLGVAGLALLLWAAVTLRRHETTILPHRGAERLVTAGPYRFRRNPIYVADVLMLRGLAEVTKCIWLVILAVPFAALVTWLAILPEEKHLEAKFGAAYRDYKASTRRWI